MDCLFSLHISTSSSLSVTHEHIKKPKFCAKGGTYTVDTSTTEKRFICCVDDRIDFKFGNIIPYNSDLSVVRIVDRMHGRGVRREAVQFVE